jgi:ribosomal protein S18 acetylase RimI-like enzyme
MPRRLAASSVRRYLQLDAAWEFFMQSEIATVADAKPLSDLVNAAYRGVGGRRGWTHEAELIAGERARSSDLAAMMSGGSTTVLIRRGDHAAALLGCVAVEMNGANKCTISMLAVAPELQAAGLGRSMLADAEQFAGGNGATIAKITVVQQREALIAWYERRGYRGTGSHEAFPYGDDGVGTPLRTDLRFVILEKIL